MAWLALIFVALVGLAAPAAPQERRGTAAVLELDGAIGPASSAYIEAGFETAREMGAEIVVLKMDTPGGLDTSMREIIRAILAMPVPVVTYVHPSGARAASAGTYILYASHIAAMSPGTNLGAATPVQIGGAPSAPDPGEQAGEDKGKTDASRTAGERKAINDAVAFIRSLAEMRGRNADWAEAAVREAESLSADAALGVGVIDVVAPDVPSLLRQLDGRSVSVGGEERILRTEELELAAIDMDWSTRLLATITNPNVALILMMIGVYGLLFEFMNPGALYPGTIGAISLLIGMYALAALPVDVVGVALIILGIALMVAEAFSPSFGILGLGGIAAFVFGATVLIDTDVPAFSIDWAVIGALAVFSAGFVVLAGRLAMRSRRVPVQTGWEEMIGARGEVIDWSNGVGHVFVRSERWQAVGPPSLRAGETVIVEDIEGLCLRVSAVQQGAPAT